MEPQQKTQRQALRDRQIEDRATAEEMLKDDPEIQTMLKEMILQHHDELKRIRKKRKKLVRRLKEEDEFTRYFNKRVFDVVLEGKRIKPLKRGIRHMLSALQQARGKPLFNNNCEWQQKYQHATQEVQIDDVARHYIPNEFGGSYSQHANLRCPFHEDRSPSLKLYLKDNRFHCFGCGASGSPIDFVMKIRNCDFREAVETLSVF